VFMFQLHERFLREVRSTGPFIHKYNR